MCIMGINMVVMQPTSLCNLNCRYCYVPFRQDPVIMSDAVLESSIQLSLNSSLIKDKLEMLWHAGEPLTVGLKFYQKCIKLIEKYQPKDTDIQIIKSIQTNGTLINKNWSQFFKENDFRIGVSVDGPEFLHNKNRKNWSNQGSFHKSIAGYQMLKDYGVEPGMITVLTKEHLSYPDELFEFYVTNDVKSVGLNLEEIENANKVSSLGATSINIPQELLELYKNFMSRLFDLWWANPQLIRIREISDTVRSLYDKTRNVNFCRLPDESHDLAIITIHKNGDISTFSPEFAGAQDDRYNNFIVGNVLEIDDFSDILENESFKKIKSDIDIGRELCSKECEYFDLCGSSFVSNRYYESGRLDATESISCILHRQVLTSLIIEKLKNVKSANLLN